MREFTIRIPDGANEPRLSSTVMLSERSHESSTTTWEPVCQGVVVKRDIIDNAAVAGEAARKPPNELSVTILLRPEWVFEVIEAASEGGSNDAEHDLLMEISDQVREHILNRLRKGE